MLTSLPVVRASEVSLFFACAHVPRSRSRSCYSYLDYFLCLCWTLIHHFPEYTYLCGRKWPARRWTLGAGFPRVSIIPDIGAPTKTAGSCPLLLRLPSFSNHNTLSPVVHFHHSRSFPTTRLPPTSTNCEWESSARSPSYGWGKPTRLTIVAPHCRSSLSSKNNIPTTMFAKFFLAAVALQALLVCADPGPIIPGEYMRLVLLGIHE